MSLAEKIRPGYREQLQSCKEQHNKRMQSDQTTANIALQAEQADAWLY